jgi:U3 small nucleolar RNA-associated protein 18
MGKSKSSKKVETEKDNEELELEKIVFGDLEGFESGLRQLDVDNEQLYDEYQDEDADDDPSKEDSKDMSGVNDDNLFFVDEGEAVLDNAASSSEEDSDSDSTSSSEESDGVAWEDSDDERLQVSLVSRDQLRKLRKTPDDTTVNGREYTKRLRSMFEKMNGEQKWARSKKEDEASDSDEAMDEDESEIQGAADPLSKLLQSTSSYVSKAESKLLPPTSIDISRLKDATQNAASKSAIQMLNFHPTHPLLLSGGYDRTLRMYHIDGRTNPLATSLHVRESPFQTAQFHPDGKRVFAAGRRRYLYIWDIETGSATKITRMYGHEQTQRSMEKFELSPCGRYVGLMGKNGWLNVLSATSGQWIAGAKVEGLIADIAWHHDGEHVSIVNTNGEVWEWNTTTRQFTNRWRDESGVGITTLALGGRNNRWCAIGSQSGIVNVYDRKNPTIGMQLSDAEAPTYKPIASLDQLVTTISSLKFSPDGQILAMASRAKKDALRLVHVPSFTVFQNWPTSGTPLGRVCSLAFTPGTELLCIGNLAGHARLWKLNHYSK